MLVCVIFSAFFSATETAFSSFNRTRLKTLAEDGNKRAKLVLDLAAKYDRLISTILIGNNIVNIAVASLGTVLFVSFYGDIGATISTVVVTVVVLIFGEISLGCFIRSTSFSACGRSSSIFSSNRKTTTKCRRRNCLCSWKKCRKSAV